jgi:dTDP-4-dehydrorhamnose reductase
MARVLITGASGLLGLTLCMETYQEHQVTGIVHTHSVRSKHFEVIQADLADFDALVRILDQVQPEVIVHTAAMANIDQCEMQPEAALRINALLPGKLAQISQRAGIHLVHISTDAVFDGKKGNYQEYDPPAPLGVYARSKLAGEQAVLENDGRAIVARVNFYGWSLSGERSLAEWFIRNLSAGNPVKGFTDVFFCPLLVNDLAKLLVEMISFKLHGIFHVVSSECTSKYAFGLRIARRFGLDENLIHPTSVSDGGLLAARSPNLSLCSEKLCTVLGKPTPDQDEGIDRFYQQYLDGLPARVRAMGRI